MGACIFELRGEIAVNCHVEIMEAAAEDVTADVIFGVETGNARYDGGGTICIECKLSQLFNC